MLRRRASGLSLVLLAATLSPAAAGAATIIGPYVSLGGGYNILQDTRTYFAPETINPRGSRRTYRWTDGFVGEGAIGFGFGNGLRAELEGDDYGNTVNNRVRSGIPNSTTGNTNMYGPMVNILYDIDLARFGLDVPVTPYVGVGAGYQWNHLSPLTSVQSDVPNHGSISRVGGTNGSFAYQGIVGVSYDIHAVPGLAVSAEYRFLGTDDETEDPYHVQDFDGRIARSGPVYFGDRFNHSLMLGLRYAFDAAPPPPPPAPAPVVPAAPPAQARTYLVFFDWDRSVLTDRARAIVSEAAQASTHVQTTRLEVDGYTDTSSIHGGDRGASYNQALSVRRAQSVKAELVRDGVPDTAIDIHGYGEGHPLVATGPNTREPQNRRVEIILR